MTTLFNNLGMPVMYTHKNGSMTSINAVSGPNVANAQNIGGNTYYSGNDFQNAMYSHKTGNTIAYRGMNGQLIRQDVDLGNGNVVYKDGKGNTIGYSHKTSGCTTIRDGQHKIVGFIK